jgi:DNA invertase Pin-like site-specific DNA recombinase
LATPAPGRAVKTPPKVPEFGPSRCFPGTPSVGDNRAMRAPPTLTPAAAYLRMSSDQQGGSIEQQREGIKRYAATHGFLIVEEYCDEGKSGSRKQEKRTEFHRIVADAEAGKFKAILCWDVSRFGRQDSLDAAAAKSRLRRSGVFLETVTQGRIDWGTFIGRVQDALLQEAAHEYARTLGSNSVRGRVSAVEQGWWPHGVCPYGYLRAVFNNQGERVQVIPRNAAGVGKARGYRVKLEPEPAEAELIRWIFDQFVNRDTSLRQIALEVEERGVAAPRKGQTGWSYRLIRYILENPIYAGDVTIGQVKRGTEEPFTKAPATVKSGALPALVDRRTFDLAQGKLDRNRAGRRKTRGNAKSMFCGLVICKRCGFRMVRKHKEGEQAYFVCSQAVHAVKAGRCRQWAVQERTLYRTLGILGSMIDRELLDAAKPTGKQITPEQARQQEVDRLTAEQDALKQKVDQAEERVLTAPAALVGGLTGKLLKWKEELDAASRRVKAAESVVVEDRERGQLARWWRDNRDGLVRLKGFEQDEHDVAVMAVDQARELLHRLGVQIEIEWKDFKEDGRNRLRPGRARVAARLGWPDNRMKVSVRTGVQCAELDHPMGEGSGRWSGVRRSPPAGGRPRKEGTGSGLRSTGSRRSGRSLVPVGCCGRCREWQS